MSASRDPGGPRREFPRVLEVDDLTFASEDEEAEIVPYSVVADDLSDAYNVLRPQIGPHSVSDQSVYGPGFSMLGEMNVVTRAEVADHLRAPIPSLGERPCVHGEECEGRNLVGPPQPITLREHISASKDQKSKSAGPSLCILCERLASNYAVIQDLVENQMGVSSMVHHANYVDRPGEYSLSQCLIGAGKSPLKISTAVVAHCRACYEWVPPTASVPGHFVESGYIFPEQEPQPDFGQGATAMGPTTVSQTEEEEMPEAEAEAAEPPRSHLLRASTQLDH